MVREQRPSSAVEVDVRDRSAIDDVADAGVDSVAVCGSGGEAHALGPDRNANVLSRPAAGHVRADRSRGGVDCTGRVTHCAVDEVASAQETSDEFRSRELVDLPGRADLLDDTI